MPTSDLLKLKAKIEALSPADRLRLAAAFIEHQKYDLAAIIVADIAAQLRALQVLTP
jgi:hypothetical protein